MSFSRILQTVSSKSMLTIGSIISTGSYVTYKDRSRYLVMEKAFMHGNILPPLAENRFETCYYPREEVECRLRPALAPDFSNEYYLVSGGVGSGKTRTVVELVRRSMTERGTKGLGAPIYVHASQGKSFPDTLAAAVNFHFDEHISFRFFMNFALRIDSFPKRDEHQKLHRVLDALEIAAFQYTQKTGRPVVLVIDGVSSLPKRMHGALEVVQDKAKLWADTNVIKVIFVSHDERTSDIMQKHASNWSRAALPIYIGDMTKQQTVDYLRRPQVLESDQLQSCPLPMTTEQAEVIYDLVGGRIHHLMAFKRDWALDVPIEHTSQELRNKEREKFIDVSKSGSILKAIGLIKSAGEKGVPLASFISVCSQQDMSALVQYDIIRVERTISGMVAVFESRLTENVAKSISVPT